MGPCEENAFSPVIDDPNFTGIVIFVPQVIARETLELSAHQSLRPSLFGTCCFAYDAQGLGADFIKSLVFVVEDLNKNKQYSGKMHCGPMGRRMPRPEALSSQDAKRMPKGLMIEQYFNPNLAQVLGLKAQPGRYKIVVKLGKHQSNQCVFEVVP